MIYIDIDGTLRDLHTLAGIDPSTWDAKNGNGEGILDFYDNRVNFLKQCGLTSYGKTIKKFITRMDKENRLDELCLISSVRNTKKKWKKYTTEWVITYINSRINIIFVDTPDLKADYVTIHDILIDDRPDKSVAERTIMPAFKYNNDIIALQRVSPEELYSIFNDIVLRLQTNKGITEILTDLGYIKKDSIDVDYKKARSELYSLMKEHLGRKYDNDKIQWDLVPFDALEGMVRVLMFGAKKYAPDNWKYVKDGRTRYYSAALRHLFAWFRGEKVDPETKQSHLDHAMCCLLFLSWKEKNDPEDKLPAISDNRRNS